MQIVSEYTEGINHAMWELRLHMYIYFRALSYYRSQKPLWRNYCTALAKILTLNVSTLPILRSHKVTEYGKALSQNLRLTGCTSATLLCHSPSALQACVICHCNSNMQSQNAFNSKHDTYPFQNCTSFWSSTVAALMWYCRFLQQVNDNRLSFAAEHLSINCCLY